MKGEINTLAIWARAVVKKCYYCEQDATHVLGSTADVFGYLPPVPVCKEHLEINQAREHPFDIVLPIS